MVFLNVYKKLSKTSLIKKVNVARKKLQARKTVDSSENLPLSNLNELPALITCPQTDQNYTILDESGYIHAYLPPSIQFLKGNICRLVLVTIISYDASNCYWKQICFLLHGLQLHTSLLQKLRESE